ncbi:SIS domain-containing protein [Candidatus Latescibacterota bacterium]
MSETGFVREISRQPEALRTVAAFYASDDGRALLERCAGLAGTCRRLVFTGMGTSLYAPYLVANELTDGNRTVERHDAGELLHFGLDSLYENDILIAVSQSGESAETKRVVEEVTGRIPVISIVNNVESTMGQCADLTLPLLAGEEASISTTTYTNTLAVLLLLSSQITSGNSGSTVDGLLKTANLIEESLDTLRLFAAEAARYFRDFNSLHIIGRGSDLVTSRQWALILKEGAGIFTEALSAGLYRHGPIELSGEGHAAAYVVSRDNRSYLTCGLAKETHCAGSRVLVLSEGTIDEGSLPQGVLQVVIPGSGGRYFPTMCAPFIEYFVHEAAAIRGQEAGVFRHATKITSRE